MRALVTRPRADAAGLERALTARGFTVLVEPLLAVVPLANPRLPLDGAQGVLITSANGARALAAATERRDLPIWAVGETSAAAARGHGFAQVAAAGGDVEALADLVAACADPRAGPLVHGAGSHVAGDLAGRLARKGFAVRRAVLYEARAATALSQRAVAEITGGHIDVALFFSPRSAATFVTLAHAAALDGACARIVAYGLSPAVAEELAALPWRDVRKAPHPTQAALLAGLDADLAAGFVTDGVDDRMNREP